MTFVRPFMSRRINAHLATFVAGILSSSFVHAQPIEWMQRSVSGSPSARSWHAMAFDSARGVCVVYGGDTREPWEWNGAVWTGRNVLGPERLHFGTAMAYDSARGVSVVFGGFKDVYTNETWEWNGSEWTQRLVAAPSRREGHRMVFDSLRGVTVLFGGGRSSLEALGDTWIWNGSTWTQRTVSGPSPRLFYAMAYDSTRHVTVLYGGMTSSGDANSDTWEWDGSQWTQRLVAAPPPRHSAAMVYDSDRHVMVLFGGAVPGPGPYDVTVSDETWEWDGSAWTRREVVNGPSSRIGHAMAYDSARHATVLFGGLNDFVYSNETWELSCIGLPLQPDSQIACPGGPATFSLHAAGYGPFTYQWRHGEPRVEIPGQNGPSYTIAHVTDTDVDVYDCVVTNDCGSIICNPARLTICSADFNCDGALDFFDYDDFVIALESGDPRADFNHDQTIDLFDYDAFVLAFEHGC